MFVRMREFRRVASPPRGVVRETFFEQIQNAAVGFDFPQRRFKIFPGGNKRRCAAGVGYPEYDKSLRP